MRVALSLLLALASCMPLAQEGGAWTESRGYAKPFDEVWSALTETLEKKGFKAQSANKVARTVETEWKVVVAPTYRRGHRDKLDVEIREPSPGKFSVRIRPTREINDNPRNPMSEKDAEWVAAGGDDPMAEEIQMLLKLKLAGSGLDD